jgi:7,8-dihydropterin-6-yl-methyl-4-(beta-D-ribofuranosyl)aminobenzene 5'-phosphate synthase
MTNTRIIVLVENTAGGRDVLAEHGLSCWIEHGDKRILFDTGQGGVLAGNAYKLKIPFQDLDALVLSHGHHDHTGGAVEALKTTKSAAIFAHPAALARKFVRTPDGAAREIGMPQSTRKIILAAGKRFIASERPTAVYNGLFTTGAVPRSTDFEDTGGPFFLDEALARPDPLEDDQSLFFDSSEGTVVLLGCAHAGVVNILRYIRRLTDERPIRAVIGGMHLVNASTHRIERTIEELKHLGVGLVAPAHCTGLPATVALWNAFPGQCQPCSVGATWEYD